MLRHCCLGKCGSHTDRQDFMASAMLLGFPRMESRIPTTLVLNPGNMKESARPYPRDSDTTALGWGIGMLFKNIFFKRFYSFIHERHTERGRDIGRGRRSRLHAESLMWDSIQDSGITPWAKGRCSTTEPPRRPDANVLEEWKAESSYYLL